MRAHQSTSYIKGVKYSLLSEEEIKKIGVVEITNSSIFIGETPAHGGIYESRLGTTRNYSCGTCFLKQADVKKCPGHFGYIKLNYPIKNPLTLDHALIWINLLCWKC